MLLKRKINKMTNSISCPVCENLCSTQAVSCPKCGHPFNNKETLKNESSTKGKQPFVIIFKVIAYISLAIGGINGLFLAVAIIAAFFVDNRYTFWEKEGVKTVLYFLIGMVSYGFFSFLISVSQRK